MNVCFSILDDTCPRSKFVYNVQRLLGVPSPEITHCWVEYRRVRYELLPVHGVVTSQAAQHDDLYSYYVVDRCVLPMMTRRYTPFYTCASFVCDAVGIKNTVFPGKLYEALRS